MGVSELWTGDGSLYRFTESTSLDPEKGTILIDRQVSSPTMTDNVTLVEDKEKGEINMEHQEPNNESGSTLTGNYDDKKSDYSVISIVKDNITLTKPALDASLKETYPSHLRYAFMISSLCNNSSISYAKETNEWKTVGDPTEVALVVASQKGKLGRDYWERKKNYKKIYECAFDSERKLMSVVYKAEKDKVLLLCKGAPEELMRKCKFYLSEEESVAMNDEFANKVSKESSRMACRGLRVLGLAYKKSTLAEENEIVNVDDNGDPLIPAEYAEVNLTFIGLIGMIDPPKAGVKEAIETCQEAGVRVMMITGDHVKTATAIATQLGIFHPDQPDKVMIFLCLYSLLTPFSRIVLF